MPDAPAAPVQQELLPMPKDGVDPNVVLPKAVRDAIARSTEVHNAVYNPENPPPPNPTAPQPPPAPPPVVVANGTQPPTNGTQPPPAPPPAPPAELPENHPDGTPNWENRFKALKGRYDSDQRRWNETQEQFNQRMRERDAEVARLSRQPLPGENLDQPPVLVSQQELADYGADFIDVVKRAAVEAVLPMMKPIATEVGQMRARVETTENETGRQFVQRMHGAMDAAVPIWKDLNGDPNFIAWVKRPDVYSGLNRQELLQKAWYAGDSNRVAAFFTGFLAEEAATDPAAAQARQQAMLSAGGHALPNGAMPASPTPPPAPRVTLESLAAPGRARPAGTPPPGGKPVWTAAGISQFYMDVANGKFRGRDAERIATEQDLMAAQREGRIQVNPRTATSTMG